MYDPQTGFTLTPVDFVERGYRAGAHLVTPAVDPDEFDTYHRYDYADRARRLAAADGNRTPSSAAPDDVERQRLLARQYEAQLTADTPKNAAVRFVAEEYDTLKKQLGVEVRRGDIDAARKTEQQIKDKFKMHEPELRRFMRAEVQTAGDVGKKLYENAMEMARQGYLDEPLAIVGANSQPVQSTARDFLGQYSDDAKAFARKGIAEKFGLTDAEAQPLADRDNPLHRVFKPMLDSFDASDKALSLAARNPAGKEYREAATAQGDARATIRTFASFASKYADDEYGVADFVRVMYPMLGNYVTEPQLDEWKAEFDRRPENMSADVWSGNLQKAFSEAAPSSVVEVTGEDGKKHYEKVKSPDFDENTLRPIALKALQKIQDERGATDPAMMAGALKTAAAQTAALQNLMQVRLDAIGLGDSVVDSVVSSVKGDSGATPLEQMQTSAERLASSMGVALDANGNIQPLAGETIGSPLLTQRFMQALMRESVDRDFDAVGDITKYLSSLTDVPEAQMRPDVAAAVDIIKSARDQGVPGRTVQEAFAAVAGYAPKDDTPKDIAERPSAAMPGVMTTVVDGEEREAAGINPFTGEKAESAAQLVPPSDGNAVSEFYSQRQKSVGAHGEAAASAFGKYLPSVRARFESGALQTSDGTLRSAMTGLAEGIDREIRRQGTSRRKDKDHVQNTDDDLKNAGRCLRFVWESPSKTKDNPHIGGFDMGDLPDSVKAELDNGEALRLLTVPEDQTGFSLHAGTMVKAWGGANTNEEVAGRFKKPLYDLTVQLNRGLPLSATDEEKTAFARKACLFFQMVHGHAWVMDRTRVSMPIDGSVFSADFESYNIDTERLLRSTSPERTSVLKGIFGQPLYNVYSKKENAEAACKNFLEANGITVPKEVFDSGYSPFKAAGIGTPKNGQKGLDLSGALVNADYVLGGMYPASENAEPGDPAGSRAAKRDVDREGAPMPAPQSTGDAARAVLSQLYVGDPALQASAFGLQQHLRSLCSSPEEAARLYQELMVEGREIWRKGKHKAFMPWIERQKSVRPVYIDVTNNVEAGHGYRQVIPKLTYSTAERQKLADSMKISLAELLRKSEENRAVLQRQGALIDSESIKSESREQ